MASVAYAHCKGLLSWSVLLYFVDTYGFRMHILSWCVSYCQGVYLCVPHLQLPSSKEIEIISMVFMWKTMKWTSECNGPVLTFSPSPVDLQVKSLVFDQSGTYLAVGGSDIRVYICKQWSEVLNFTGECSLTFPHKVKNKKIIKINKCHHQIACWVVSPEGSYFTWAIVCRL